MKRAPTTSARTDRYRRLVAARRFMDQHYAGSPALDAIAGAAFLSRYHFLRLFKSVYHQTPGQYLTAVRLAKARALLSSGAGPHAACLAIGFDSISTFTTLFKRATGQTPAAYRNACLLRRAEIARAPLAFIPACFAGVNGWVENRNIEEPG
jgi:AraC-like DNA-binding protein